MNLRLVLIEPTSNTADWEIDRPARGVVLINVEVVGLHEPAPLHWRVGTWVKPPLDIRLDREGRFIGFQFVFQDEKVPEEASRNLPAPTAGLPVFDTQHWPTDRYLDRKSEVSASRLTGRELLLRFGNERFVQHVCLVAPALSMGFADDDELIEIRLGPLPSEDWESLDTLSMGES